ncbi:TetR/AcrR family transcriptional regulator [Glutamicibacter endophyticus]|uniref:TetR/AcrR family transcriptional regulator n=1 Tax=Glutamicibacter endophyticus TaxID=1522174 RepID=UPI003AF0D987
MTKPSARTRILQAAADRFYADGISATGIDAIIADAGVAKMSLYNNFESKSGLVMAYLEQRHTEWLELYAARLASSTSALERVLAVVDAYIDHAEAGYAHGFRGCGLLNAAAELPVGEPGRAVVAGHKSQVRGFFAEHLEANGCADPQEVASHCSFVLEGAMALAGLEGNSSALRKARTLIRELAGGR